MNFRGTQKRPLKETCLNIGNVTQGGTEGFCVLPVRYYIKYDEKASQAHHGKKKREGTV